MAADEGIPRRGIPADDNAGFACVCPFAALRFPSEPTAGSSKEKGNVFFS